MAQELWKYNCKFYGSFQSRVVLIHAADGWAYCGRDAFCVENVAALIIRHLTTSHRAASRGEFEDALKRVERVEQELQRFHLKVTLNQLTVVRDLILDTMDYAADEWALGDPEDPPCELVLNWMIAILFEHGLTRLPPQSWPKNPVLA